MLFISFIQTNVRIIPTFQFYWYLQKNYSFISTSLNLIPFNWPALCCQQEFMKTYTFVSTTDQDMDKPNKKVTSLNKTWRLMGILYPNQLSSSNMKVLIWLILSQGHKSIARVQSLGCHRKNVEIFKSEDLSADNCPSYASTFKAGQGRKYDIRNIFPFCI